MSQNVPDVTTTIEEKRLAISYIDRMLSCDDITAFDREYWENKKLILQDEIRNAQMENFLNHSENVLMNMPDFEAMFQNLDGLERVSYFRGVVRDLQIELREMDNVAMQYWGNPNGSGDPNDPVFMRFHGLKRDIQHLLGQARYYLNEALRIMPGYNESILVDTNAQNVK
jgi:hypothetical protein